MPRAAKTRTRLPTAIQRTRTRQPPSEWGELGCCWSKGSSGSAKLLPGWRPDHPQGCPTATPTRHRTLFFHRIRRHYIQDIASVATPATWTPAWGARKCAHPTWKCVGWAPPTNRLERNQPAGLLVWGATPALPASVTIQALGEVWQSSTYTRSLRKKLCHCEKSGSVSARGLGS